MGARVTVRRLRDDVEEASTRAETDPESFRHTGGLPPEARAVGGGPDEAGWPDLTSHHIHFRSAHGPDDPEDRITLCAFHHLRGVHGGLPAG